VDAFVDALRRWWLRLRFYLFRARYDREMEEEMRHHLELRAAELAHEGMSEGEARDAARRRFGNRTLLQEQRRSAVGLMWLQTLGQDGRYVLRSLCHSPGFATMVVLTLGLGIGANAAMFGIVDRLLLRGPEHVVEPERVVRVYVTHRNPAGREETRSATGYALYAALRDHAGAFERVAAYSKRDATTGRGAGASELRVALVTWDFFPLLGVRPALGRFFGRDEDRPPQGENVVVLDGGYWERAFGADSGVLGRTLDINGSPFTIVGVAPKGFTGAELERRDAWVPVSARASPPPHPDWPTTWNAEWLDVIGRLKPGVTPRRAGADATAAHQRAYAGPPGDAFARATLSVAPLRYTGERKESTEVAISRWLVGVAAVVLLVACANAGNLALARVLRRRREVAVRLALGISRGRLVRLLLAESVFLSLAGGAMGLVLALVGGRFIRDVLLPDVLWTASPVDARVLVVTAVAALATGVLVGLVPALQGSRPDLTAALKAGAREGGVQRSRLRGALTVTQAALSVVLLVGAGLFVRSLSKIQALRIGIEPDRVLAVEVAWPNDPRIPHEEAERLGARRKALYERTLERLRQLPGIEHASLAIGSPFRSSFGVGLSVPGLDSLPRLPGGGPWVSVVTSDYFRTVGTRVLRGRVFTPADGPTSARVAVVSEAMARTLWPDGSAIGRCLLLNDAPCSRVVGVVEDARRWQLLHEEPAMQYYIPFGQEGGISGTTLLVRPVGEAVKMIGTVRRELQQLEPAVGYISVQTLQEIINPQIRPWRLGATMFTAFGGLALLVAAIGIYSLIAYLVAQRTHELGVRMALGARAPDIVRLIMSRGIAPAMFGLALGVALALTLGRFVEPLLFQTSPRDLGVFVIVTATLLAFAVLASLVPTWRATRVDPLVALRTEG
jgi:predicted permease